MILSNTESTYLNLNDKYLVVQGYNQKDIEINEFRVAVNRTKRWCIDSNLSYFFCIPSPKLTEGVVRTFINVYYPKWVCFLEVLINPEFSKYEEFLFIDIDCFPINMKATPFTYLDNHDLVLWKLSERGLMGNSGFVLIKRHILEQYCELYFKKNPKDIDLDYFLKFETVDNDEVAFHKYFNDDSRGNFLPYNDRYLGHFGNHCVRNQFFHIVGNYRLISEQNGIYNIPEPKERHLAFKKAQVDFFKRNFPSVYSLVKTDSYQVVSDTTDKKKKTYNAGKLTKESIQRAAYLKFPSDAYVVFGIEINISELIYVNPYYNVEHSILSIPTDKVDILRAIHINLLNGMELKEAIRKEIPNE